MFNSKLNAQLSPQTLSANFSSDPSFYSCDFSTMRNDTGDHVITPAKKQSISAST